MNYKVLIILFSLLICLTEVTNADKYKKSQSVYQTKIIDTSAVYFTKEHFNISSEGKEDISDELQRAIYELKEKKNFGIVFIPEGTYIISKTIYIPKAIRLIGYGNNRPLIKLVDNSNDFQDPVSSDKGKADYMFWFTSGIPKPGKEIEDANPGTFYSALMNIDLEIGDGNPSAVALRTHFAQHSFIAHVDIYINNGKAGIFDVGNEIENVRFYGGQYGIYTTKTSPGWPFIMVDTYFSGQKKAAIKTQEAGLTIVRMNVKDVPVVIETNDGYFEKLFMKDCQLSNIFKTAIIISLENNPFTQINLRNIDCENVPVLASFRESSKIINGKGEIYKVENFTHGNQIDNLGVKPVVKTTYEIKEQKTLQEPVIKDIPNFPHTSTWVNIKDIGAKGDGNTDDTKVIIDAIAKHNVIYFPQGLYRISEKITLKPNTVLIGLHPIATQIILKDNTESFGGFGTPKALIETPSGGTNIVSGIGIDAGARNPRVVACKWMAGANSYMNDIKFVGGHGSMTHKKGWVPVYNKSRTADANPDLIWDSQFWSLWITNGGGGVFKDIWTASPYAAAGMYVSNTSTVGKIYAMSVEHHVRNEVKIKNISNWEFYALQFEEENPESWNCQPLEIENSSNIIFGNLYFFRTIRLVNPYPYCINTWGENDIDYLNVHNYTQVKHTIDNMLYDINTNMEVRSWQIASLHLNIKGPIPNKSSLSEGKEKVIKLAGGFEFADGICNDSRGNVYFCDARWKRIYKWSVETNSLSLITDMPYKPMSMACDSKDNLLVVVEYVSPKGATKNGIEIKIEKQPDYKGTSYAYWYNNNATTRVYAINPENAEGSMSVINLKSIDSVTEISKVLYPANRWRDSKDYLKVTVQKPEYCYVAPDGKTIIPDTYDLMRCNSLLPAYPGNKFYAIDEYYKRTIEFEVDQKGFLSNPQVFTDKGEYNLAHDNQGNIYIPDEDILIYNKKGELTDRIYVPERPATIAFGGKDGNTLFITARSSLYSIQIK
ncbi:glycosyl hydrolase family 28-related protein [Bacteroidota bacterium]